MKQALTFVILSLLLLGVVPAAAGFLAEPVDEGIYFVSYQRGQLLRGNILFDREKKVQKRLVKKSHHFCLEEGYTHLKFPNLGEIARDEHLRAVWELGAGDSGQNTSQVEATELSLNHVHKTRKLLLLSNELDAGFQACLGDD